MDTPLDNIQRFNLVAVHLFSKLHATFPVPQEIDPTVLGHSAVPENASEQAAWDMGVEATDTIIWLEEEGFIRIQAKALGGQMFGVRLTLKAMSILGQVPTSVSQATVKRSLISRMKDAVANASATAATEAASGLMSELFALAVRSAIGAAGSSVSASSLSA
ncbi:MAG: hypothetical protein ACK5V0_13045 [Alphaproteobacteria bacterium]|nr:hypothetical protein [Rhizobiaceae bacterium]